MDASQTGSEQPPAQAIDALRQAHCVVIFSGAGMSAESEIPTFRDAQTGFWAKYSPEDLASPQGWRLDRERVWAWYEWRRFLATQAVPNAGHIAVAALAQHKLVTVITQNVDDLHERAGSADVLHLHGSLFRPRCAACARPAKLMVVSQTPVERAPPPLCSHCQSYVRPGVVWFGENLPQDVWRQAEHAVASCDMLIAVGTSGVVYPAASLIAAAARSGKFVLELNPISSALESSATLSWQVGAAVGLPSLVGQSAHKN